MVEPCCEPLTYCPFIRDASGTVCNAINGPRPKHLSLLNSRYIRELYFAFECVMDVGVHNIEAS